MADRVTYFDVCPSINPDYLAYKLGYNNDGDRAAILAVNIRGRTGTPVAQTVTFALPPYAAANATVTVQGESRTIAASGGYFSDTFAGMQVHRYTFPVTGIDPMAGETYFPSGWWVHRANSSVENMAVYAARGQYFQILSDSYIVSSLPNMIAYLNALQAVGGLGVACMCRGAAGMAITTTDLAAAVNTLKSHPALAGYLIGDEPEKNSATPASYFQPYYNVIKLNDPAHFVMMSHDMPNTEDEWARIEPYFPYEDVMGLHMYPYWAQDGEFAGYRGRMQYDYWMRFIGLADAVGKPVIATGQGFGQGFSPWRNPTINELRYQMFSAIVQDVGRISFWMDSYGIAEGTEPLVTRVCGEANAIAEELLNGQSGASGEDGGGGGVGGAIINITHGAGNLNEYTTTTGTGLSASAAAAMAGTAYGLAVAIGDTTDRYATKQLDAASATGAVRFRYYIDPNTLTMASGDEFTTGIPYNNSNGWLCQVNLRRYGTAYYVRVRAIDDAGAVLNTAYYTVTDAPHWVEVLETRATNSTSADGRVTLWIDTLDAPLETLSAIDNYDKFANFLKISIGAFNGIDAGTNGTLYLDQLVVRPDTLPIGASYTEVTITANNLDTSPVVLGTPSILQIISITPDNLVTGAPVLGEPNGSGTVVTFAPPVSRTTVVKAQSRTCQVLL